MARMLVTVKYKGTLDDGTVFDEGKEPISYVEGSHQVIPGFESAVAAMQPGDKRTVHLEPKDAYGDRDERNIQVLPVDQIPNGDQLPVGQTVYFRTAYGPQPALIQKIEDGKVHIDFNHTLAGKALNFDLELISREEAPDQGCAGCAGCGDPSASACSGCH